MRYAVIIVAAIGVSIAWTVFSLENNAWLMLGHVVLLKIFNKVV
jgi:hypothetical protein